MKKPSASVTEREVSVPIKPLRGNSSWKEFKPKLKKYNSQVMESVDQDIEKKGEEGLLSFYNDELAGIKDQLKDAKSRLEIAKKENELMRSLTVIKKEVNDLKNSKTFIKEKKNFLKQEEDSDDEKESMKSRPAAKRKSM